MSCPDPEHDLQQFKLLMILPEQDSIAFVNTQAFLHVLRPMAAFEKGYHRRACCGVQAQQSGRRRRR